MSKIYFKFSDNFINKNPEILYNTDINLLIKDPEGTVFYMMKEIESCGVGLTYGNSWPEKKIVIAHPRALDKVCLRNIKNNYIISWQMDFPKCLYAHEHIVMNSAMKNTVSLIDVLTCRNVFEILHFIPQPNLISRNSLRGDLFANVVYMGEKKNLLQELQDENWINKLKKFGINFSVIDDATMMSDYSEVDCVVALRPLEQNTHTKPPTKLWNAWRAGVPAILGVEPGYRDYYITELDYCEASSASEVFEILMKLKNDKEIRKSMTLNGYSRANVCSLQHITGEWCMYLNEVVINRADAWLSSKIRPFLHILRYLIRRFFRKLTVLMK